MVDAALAGEWVAARAAWRTPADRPAGETFCETIHHVRGRLMDRMAVYGTGEDRQPGLRPADRVLVERLAAAFGELVWDWLNGADGVQQFTSQVTPLLASAAPPELAGCAACPARCTMLASVSRVDLVRAAGVLASAAPKEAQNAFGATVTPEQRLGRLLPKLTQIEPPVAAGEANPVKWKRDWRYCLLNLVPLPADQADHRDEVLASLVSLPT